MRAEEPTAFLPYWDWTDHEGVDQRLFTGKRLGARNGPLTRGYFAYEAPGMGQNTTNRPSWWPNNFDGWRIPQGLQYGHGAALTRVVDNRPLATTGHIDAILDTNLRAHLYFARYSLPEINRNVSGAIIKIGAINHPYSGVNTYLAANLGGEGLAEAMFEDVREFGTKVCTIKPGWVNTPLVESEDIDPTLMIQPEDIAQTVLFVLSLSETACPTEIKILPQRSPYR